MKKSPIVFVLGMCAMFSLGFNAAYSAGAPDQKKILNEDYRDNFTKRCHDPALKLCPKIERKDMKMGDWARCWNILSSTPGVHFNCYNHLRWAAQEFVKKMSTVERPKPWTEYAKEYPQLFEQ